MMSNTARLRASLVQFAPADCTEAWLVDRTARVRAWAYRIASNEAYRALRRIHRRLPEAQLDEALATARRCGCRSGGRRVPSGLSAARRFYEPNACAGADR